jgi:hypothetical protein
MDADQNLCHIFARLSPNRLFTPDAPSQARFPDTPNDSIGNTRVEEQQYGLR